MEELQTQPHPSLRSTHQGRVAARKILFAAPSTSQSKGTTPKGITSFGGGRLSRRGDGTAKAHHGAMTLPCRHLFYLMLATLFTTLYRCPQALPRHVGKRTTDRRVSARGLHEIDGSEGEETRAWTTRRDRPRAGAPALPAWKKISCPAKRFPNPARGGTGAPAFSRAKNRTRRASNAVTSTTFVVTASTCLAFRSGGAVTVSSFRFASDGRRATQHCRQ